MKRLFDCLASVSCIVAVTPLFLLICFAVFLKQGTPIFFCQVRPGKNGVPFKLYKFKTMTEARDAKGNILPDAERLTLFGKFLRLTSLDELPELINVLKGEMSIVGPRPLLLPYLDRYTPEQARRHEVNPGITGWAQVNGRNALSWDEKFKLDVWYVDHRSVWLDMKIILLTIKKVMMREGINAEGAATMPEFKPQIPTIDTD
jgi:sugar transferase EpsL